MDNHKTVLIIEDTESLREFLCQELAESGFEVHGSPNGLEALSAAAKNNYQVFIIDFRMPLLNGVDTTRCLRSSYPASTIIGVSSEDKKEDFIMAGADAFLKKPYRYDNLLNLVSGKAHAES